LHALNIWYAARRLAAGALPVEWWQLGTLAVVVAFLAAGLLVLQTRLRMVESSVRSAAPSSPIPPEALAELATVRSEWATYRKNLDAYLEAFEDIDETVERKRRRIAARDSRAKRAEDEAPPEPRDQLGAYRAKARAMGIPV